MGASDTAILNSLRDGKPKEFKQILRVVKFSHNTLRVYLESLIDQNLVSKEKLSTRGRGRPGIPTLLTLQLVERPICFLIR